MMILLKGGIEGDFKDFIFNKFDHYRKGQEKKTELTPAEILDKEGYDLFECKTQEDFNKFEKYYRHDELICSIYVEGRLDTRYCFFAVRKDVDKIKREDFDFPHKDDEYSTSVLGIQFTKDEHPTVEMISRYNHSVFNPNCTLGNNLENLAPGLTASFKKLLEQRGLKLDVNCENPFEFPGYKLDKNGKYYKYNQEIGDTYYCPGNIIIENDEVKTLEPEKQLLMDHYLLDFENKTIKNMDTHFEDSFIDSFGDISDAKISKTVDKKEKTSCITITKKGQEPIKIKLDKCNRIMEYENSNAQEIGNNFLYFSEQVKKIELPNVKKIGHHFMYYAADTKEASFPKLETVGDKFMFFDTEMEHLHIPKLKYAADCFLFYNEKLEKLDVPSLEEVGDDFIYYNEKIKKFNAPKLKKVGHDCLYFNSLYNEVNQLNVDVVSFFKRKSMEENLAEKMQESDSLDEKLALQRRKENDKII